MQLSVADWLDSRQPSPPPALGARIRAEIGKLRIADAPVTPTGLTDAGAAILRSLHEAGCSDRSSAVDLLAADALFTYAFEAACESGEIQETSRYVLERITSK